jgi:hypothetical protein
MSVHTVASAIVEAQTRWARKPADFYPTPSDCTQALLDHLQLPARTVVKEPACGDGALSVVLEANGMVVLSSDLRQTGFGRGGVDFLTDADEVCDWVITNPPFNVAVDFIKRSLDLTPNVAMLLKSQFWHAQGRLDLFEQNPPSQILPLTWRPSFLEAERGNSPLMDVIWVVWQQGERETRYTPLRRPGNRGRRRRRLGITGLESDAACTYLRALGF